MEDAPLVSVLMTAFNREKYIAEAIESVLGNTYKNIELIIVDDCSIDQTLSIAESYEAKDNRVTVYFNKKNLGDYPNRNKAASYAKGKYLKYVDSDDKIFPETIAFMVDTMEKYPNAAFGISGRSANTTTCFKPYDAYYCHFFQRGLLDYGPTASIIKKEYFEDLGKFKEIRNVGDFDLWLTLALFYDVLEMPSNLVFWRQHEMQEIVLAPEYYIKYNLKIISEHLNHHACPLSESQKKIVLKKYRKSTARQLLKGAIKIRGINNSLKTWKELKLSFSDIF